MKKKREIKVMKIKEMPEQLRPREKLLIYGSDKLSNSELLAIIIGHGTVGESAIMLSMRLINSFGGLNGLFRSSLNDIVKIKGMGKVKALQVKAALTLADRLNNENFKPGIQITGSEQLYNLYKTKFIAAKKEKFIAILLDTKCKIIAEEEISIGSINCSVVHPVNVFNKAVSVCASGIIFIHNHPSGDPTPSEDDVNITLRLKKSATLLGINVYDHIIICPRKYYSFAEEGLL